MISEPKLWRVEFHYKKMVVTEQLWNVDTNGVNGVENRAVMETDAAFGPNGIDQNGDGDKADQVGYWDQDPGTGSFTLANNDGIQENP